MAEGSEKSRRVVTLSPLAEDDLYDAYAYTSLYWSQKQAEDYNRQIHEVLQTPVLSPHIARKSPDRPGTRMFLTRWRNARQGHYIFFRETAGGIYVQRILHTARNWADEIDLQE